MSIVKMEVRDYLGRKVDFFNEKLVGTYTYTLKRNNLTQGIYFYQIKTNSGSFSGKIVVAE